MTTLSSHQHLLDQLAQLRLPAFRQALEAQLAAPLYDELSFEERLSLLVETEVLQRQENRIQRRVREAHFQQTAWVQEIDFSPGRNLQRQHRRPADGRPSGRRRRRYTAQAGYAARPAGRRGLQ